MNGPGVRLAANIVPDEALSRRLEQRMSSDACMTGVWGVLLAGVHSWGECALERVRPRILLPVAGHPLLWHRLRWLGASGIRQATLCANSDTHAVRQSKAAVTCPGLDLSYYEDIMPRGPAGCIRDAALQTPAETFLVADSSGLTTLDARRLVEQHQGSGADLTVVVSESQTAREPVGVYVISRAALEEVPEKGYQDIKQMLISRLYSIGRRVVSYPVPAETTVRFKDSSSYVALCGWTLRNLLSGGGTEDYQSRAEAMIHRSAIVSPRARLVGSVRLGQGCRIGDDVVVFGPTSLDRDCTVERRCVISRSVLWQGCQVGQGAILDHCLLTDGCRIERELVARDTLFLPDGSPGDLL